jgi:hypothetical protein
LTVPSSNSVQTKTRRKAGFLLSANRVTQSAAMSALHPALRADWLVLRRTGAVASVRMFGAPVLLLACCVALACGDLYKGYGWCLAAAALPALGGSHAIAHRRVLDALERWRFGWCGALPIARGRTAWTLSIVTIVALLVSLMFVSALLLIVSASAPHRGDLPYALAGIDLALIVGTSVAMVRALRIGARTNHAGGIREPVLALPWLNDTRLPHLPDWQRRAALVRWRRGGSFVMVGIVLGAVPMGAPMVPVAGLVLLVLSWSWLAVAMRASADATTDAVRLLGATPLDFARARRASFRYPVAAALCGLVWMIVGIALLRQGMIAPAWIVLAGIASAWPMLRILRTTRDTESSA